MFLYMDIHVLWVPSEGAAAPCTPLLLTKINAMFASFMQDGTQFLWIPFDPTLLHLLSVKMFNYLSSNFDRTAVLRFEFF